MNLPLIALVTDFGADDPCVGIMKGIISMISPDSALIDLTHQIPPGDIQRGAFVLWQASLDLPKETVFLAVVDPGVGTDRRSIYLESGGQRFIGPDNGIFSYLLYNKNHQAWELSNPAYKLPSPGSTFFGRDIFAPAAAHAANGIRGKQFGTLLESILNLPEPELNQTGRTFNGEVLSTDRFGNLFTSLGRFLQNSDMSLIIDSWIHQKQYTIKDRRNIKIRTKNKSLELVHTFSNVAVGTPAGLIGSTGLLEIICNQGSASEILGLDRGDKVHLEY
ncbi:MAG: SAM-dependent chlorinase/fluorinase [Anaerolineales bacterium]|nr:SAM-dependent chlorinase/fluorinase [Anaerolineales bacterium]